MASLGFSHRVSLGCRLAACPPNSMILDRSLLAMNLKGRNRIDGRPRSVGHGQGGDGEQELCAFALLTRSPKSFQIATVQNVNTRRDQHRLMDRMSHSFDL